MAQLAFKQAKFYFRFQNDHAKGRMGPSWVVMSLQKSYFESSITAGARSDFLYTYMLFIIRKVSKTQNKIFLQQLKTQSMNSGKYVTLSNLDPFFLLRSHFESGSKISPV